MLLCGSGVFPLVTKQKPHSASQLLPHLTPQPEQSPRRRHRLPRPRQSVLRQTRAGEKKCAVRGGRRSAHRRDHQTAQHARRKIASAADESAVADLDVSTEHAAIGEDHRFA